VEKQEITTEFRYHGSMSPFRVLAALLTLAALFGWINHRWLKLSRTIALMALGLGVSLVLLALDAAGLAVRERAVQVVHAVDFDDTVLHGMLGALLFAGALHVNLGDLAREKLAIGVLAVGGTVLSTVVVAALAHVTLDALDLHLDWGWCLVFGALISPTDPIAVLGILKTAGVPKSLEIQIAGESMFNDGVGVVVFLAVLGVATGGDTSTGDVVLLFVREAVGGALFGLATGLAAYYMLRTVDSYQVEVLITLALVTGGYALAEALHLSAPIAAVVSGLFIGNQGRLFAMSETTREHLDVFWELVDEILNAVLFVLIGLEILALQLDHRLLLGGGLMVLVVLLARFVSVAVPIGILRRVRPFGTGTIRAMTWGGLRGGISVALALSLPASGPRDAIVTMTYVIVVFSVLVQGLTLRRALAGIMSRA
jgi:CPA1 family monovalent cation:H+ antiporter